MNTNSNMPRCSRDARPHNRYNRPVPHDVPMKDTGRQPAPVKRPDTEDFFDTVANNHLVQRAKVVIDDESEDLVEEGLSFLFRKVLKPKVFSYLAKLSDDDAVDYYENNSMSGSHRSKRR